MPDKQKPNGGLDVAREALTDQLTQIEEELKPYEELLERKRRVSSALSALDGETVTRRLSWEQIAEYVAAHPGVKPAEMSAALEAPLKNIFAHLARNEGRVFQRAGDGWSVIDGWETHRRDT